MDRIKKYWEKIKSIGVRPDTSLKNAKYIRMTNALAVIVGVWLVSTIPAVFLVDPASAKYIILGSIVFPLLWTLVLYFNHKGWYLFAKLYFSYSSMLCVSLNALQLGRDSDNHLFLLVASLISFYTYPPNQLKYIARVSLSALLLFIGVEVYSGWKGPVLEAPPEFFYYSRIISLVALCVLVYTLTLFNYKNLHIAQDLLEIEHKKSEDLLLNVLPPSIAARLKSSEKVIADYTKEATILFADIVGFTVLSQKISPEKLVLLLNQLFSEFDNLVARHGLEKIKTIGDAYMIAGGIPVARKDHCEVVARCALEIQKIMGEKQIPELEGLEVRIGINTGPVVAGVIGKSKFIYDLWGDSVNTASRMESHGTPGKIHVTEEVYSRLKNNFIFEGPRTIDVKGKGEMQTYFLVREKSV